MKTRNFKTVFVTLFVTVAGLFSSRAQFTADDFIITIKTDNVSTGSSAANQYEIPAEGTYTVYYESVPASIIGSAPAFTGLLCSCSSNAIQTITFPSPGIYKIGLRPTGATPLWRYVNNLAIDRLKVLSIEQWGTAKWLTTNAMFSGCTNLTTLNATDTPNMISVTNMGFMFYDASNFTGGSSMNNWATQDVTNMSAMFWGATVFNQPLGKWNTSKITNMYGMFRNATKFNQYINDWNTSAVTDMGTMFLNASAFNQPLDRWIIAPSAASMLAGSGMDCNNYSKTLQGWADNANTKNSVSFISQGGRLYGYIGQAARNTLINTKGWTINGDGFNTNCKILQDPAVIGSGANPVTGPVVKNTYLLAAQPTRYVRRIYEITPANNPATATGRVALQFSNQDFKSYNSQTPAPAFLLPDVDFSATIDARKANLLIEKRGGVSSDFSGLPGSYSGTVQTINPADEDIFWDSDNQAWEVSFDVVGFSGFFVKTSETPLPVNFGNITAALKNGLLSVNWQTLTEKNNHHFIIEASADGKAFKEIGTIPSLAKEANSNSPLEYHFEVQAGNIALGSVAALGLLVLLLPFGKKTRRLVATIAFCLSIVCIACNKNNKEALDASTKVLYIRIVQVDMDGSKEYSKVVKVVGE